VFTLSLGKSPPYLVLAKMVDVIQSHQTLRPQQQSLSKLKLLLR